MPGTVRPHRPKKEVFEGEGAVVVSSEAKEGVDGFRDGIGVVAGVM